MSRIHCSVPLEVRIHGTLDAARLAALGASVESAVAERLIETEEAVRSRLARRRTRLEPGRREAREPYDADREDRTGRYYATPAYDRAGAPTRIAMRRRGARFRPPPLRTFAQEWRDFRGHVDAGRNREALAVAARLSGSLSDEDALNHGAHLAEWLMDQGRWELAQLTLGSLEAAWWARYVSEHGPGVPSAHGLGLGSMLGGRFQPLSLPAPSEAPDRLLARARSEALAGRTEQAFRLFELAFLLTQMQIARYYRDRTEALDALPPGGFGGILPLVSRQRSYQDLGYLFGLLRQILSFYPELERAALASGDVDQANVYGNLGWVLRANLLDDFLLDEARALTMESAAATSGRGVAGYRIYGAHGREEVVEPLPGTPPPSELGDFPAYWSTLENVVRSLAGQQSFLTGLYRHPEIVAEFGATPPDMSQRSDRLRVWATMYRVYQRSAAGFGSLHRLLDLMERHLQVFTRHTSYNIRDFGISYLSSEFPQDLLGRTVADCGVYALTVAYEVYLTARGATPRLPVSFRLYAMPEHVALVIFDLDQDTHYILNNDQIDGPYRGSIGSSDVLGNLARTYGGIFGRRAVVTPTLPFELGTSTDSQASFRRRAWQRYRLSASWGFGTPPGGNSFDVYRRYYDQIEQFSTGMVALRSRVEALRRALRDADPGDRQRVLAGRLPEAVLLGAALMDVFERYGPDVARVLATQSRQLAGVQPRYLFFFAERSGGNDPLTRLGMAMRLFRSLGGRSIDATTGAVQLSGAEESLRLRLRAIPFIRSDLDGYVPPRDF